MSLDVPVNLDLLHKPEDFVMQILWQFHRYKEKIKSAKKKRTHGGRGRSPLDRISISFLFLGLEFQLTDSILDSSLTRLSVMIMSDK